MNTPSTNTQPVPSFQLLWTVGFSGKRHLDPSREPAIGVALRQVVDDLVARASARNARLAALSSLARGGDVLFAEAVRAVPASGGPLPWKCLLPFAWADFIRLDLANDAQGQPLAEAERAKRIRRAEFVLVQSLPSPEVTSPAAGIADPEQREEAYLECGYRTVDESDVMVFLLRTEEFGKLINHPPAEATAGLGVGTFAVACYARAAGRPMILLDADAADVWATRRVLNAPPREDGVDGWFVDPVVTGIVAQAAGTGLDVGKVAQEKVTLRSGPMTPVRESIVEIGAQLGALANRHQGRTHDGFRWVLRFHLAASAVAAIAATVLVVEHPEATPVVLLGALALLALIKPGLAFAAWWLEHRLHHDGTREVWLHARVLAELCRGAAAAWPLPLQPLDARDEEDFPRIKRLIRTLRLLREQDAAAAVRGTSRHPHETQLEADMRIACGIYSEERLRDQARYYQGKHRKGAAEERRWRRRFQVATWTAIIAGLVLAADRLALVAGSHLLVGVGERVLEAIIIIAPFLAAHCLGTMTILDTRRRCRRYAEMSDYLGRLANTLAQTEANPSRIRLIEHAERTLIEEQHEWFSVMRNLSI